MRMTQRATFRRDVSHTRDELLAMLRNHVLLQVRTESMMRDISSRLRHNDFEVEMNGFKDTSSMWRILREKLAICDRQLQLLSSEHQSLVDSVIEYNMLILACGEEFKSFFIMFDEQMARMFADVHPATIVHSKHRLSLGKIKNPFNRY